MTASRMSSQARARSRAARSPRPKRFFPKARVAPPIVVPRRTPQSPRGGTCRARTARRAGARARAPRRRAPRCALARLAHQALGFGERRRAASASAAALRAERRVRRRAHALGVRLRLLRRRRGLRGVVSRLFCGFRRARRRGGVFVGRASFVSSVFFSSPEHRERYLGRRRPGRDRWRGAAFRDAAVLAVVRKDARRRSAQRARRLASAMDSESRRVLERSMNERVVRRADRTGVRAPRSGSTRARDDREARDARVGDANDRGGRARRTGLSESSGIGPSEGLSPRALASARAAVKRRLGGGAPGLGGAERALGPSARRVAGSEPIGSVRFRRRARAPPPRRARPSRGRLEADAQRAGRAGRTARGPRRGRRRSLC